MSHPEDPFWRLAEHRIREAMDRGEFDGLPGAGRPLRLDDDTLVPEAQRVAYRLLRNAGYLPEELRLRRELREEEVRFGRLADAGERLRAARRLHLLRVRLEARGDGLPLDLAPAYREALLERLETDTRAGGRAEE